MSQEIPTVCLSGWMKRTPGQAQEYYDQIADQLFQFISSISGTAMKEKDGWFVTSIKKCTQAIPFDLTIQLLPGADLVKLTDCLRKAFHDPKNRGHFDHLELSAENKITILVEAET